MTREWRNAETYPDRVREQRKDRPKITAEEDEVITKRKGIPRRVKRCRSCGRSYKIAVGCWNCGAHQPESATPGPMGMTDRAYDAACDERSYGDDDTEDRRRYAATRPAK